MIKTPILNTSPLGANEARHRRARSAALSLFLIIMVLAFGVETAPLHAADPPDQPLTTHLLIDRTLRIEPVVLKGIDVHQVVFINQFGTRDSRSRDSVLAVVRQSDPPELPTATIVIDPFETAQLAPDLQPPQFRRRRGGLRVGRIEMQAAPRQLQDDVRGEPEEREAQQNNEGGEQAEDPAGEDEGDDDASVDAPTRDAADLDIPATIPGWIELVDGQHWTGVLVTDAASSGPETNEADSLNWRNPWIGNATLPLEQVRRIKLHTGSDDATSNEGIDQPDPPQLDEATALGDLVRLRNGDELEGYLVSMGRTVTVEIESSTGAVELVEVPIDRVASVSLLNRPQPPAGLQTWLRDGTVLNLADVRLAPGLVRLSPTDDTPREFEDDPDMLTGIVFDATAFVPLAGRAPSNIAGSNWYGLSEAPLATNPDTTLGLADLMIHGPIAVTYDLPRGASRFATEAIIPRPARSWADYDLIFELDEVEIARVHLDGTTMSQQISVDLADAHRDRRRLTIRITEGRYGPINDVVTLIRPLLLVEAEQTPGALRIEP